MIEMGPVGNSSPVAQNDTNIASPESLNNLGRSGRRMDTLPGFWSTLLAEADAVPREPATEDFGPEDLEAS